jgi:hypothetical protein
MTTSDVTICILDVIVLSDTGFCREARGLATNVGQLPASFYVTLSSSYPGSSLRVSPATSRSVAKVQISTSNKTLIHTLPVCSRPEPSMMVLVV